MEEGKKTGFHTISVEDSIARLKNYAKKYKNCGAFYMLELF